MKGNLYSIEETYYSMKKERDKYKKEFEDLKIEKNNLEQKYNLMLKEKDKCQRLYHEQGNLNNISILYIFFIFLSFITFAIFISVKEYKILRTKPKNKFKNFILNEDRNNLNDI